MKRMSIAEQTLKVQIERFNGTFKELESASEKIIAEMGRLAMVICDLEAEQKRLRVAREAASARATGAGRGM